MSNYKVLIKQAVKSAQKLLILEKAIDYWYPRFAKGYNKFIRDFFMSELLQDGYSIDLALNKTEKHLDIVLPIYNGFENALSKKIFYHIANVLQKMQTDFSLEMINDFYTLRTNGLDIKEFKRQLNKNKLSELAMLSFDLKIHRNARSKRKLPISDRIRGTASALTPERLENLKYGCIDDFFIDKSLPHFVKRTIKEFPKVFEYIIKNIELPAADLAKLVYTEYGLKFSTNKMAWFKALNTKGVLQIYKNI